MRLIPSSAAIVGLVVAPGLTSSDVIESGYLLPTSVNPLVGVLLGAFVLGESVQPISIAGLIVVLVAVAVIFTTQARPVTPRRSAAEVRE